MRLWNTGHVFVAIALAATNQSGVAQLTPWGLQTGDHFSVETVTEKTTTIQLEGGQESVSTTTDRVELNYNVEATRATGLIIRVTITNAQRLDGSDSDKAETESRRASPLNGFYTFLMVAPDGRITDVPGRRESLRRLSGHDRLGLEALYDLCSDQVMSSWLGRPFWLTFSGEPPGPDDNWDRIEETSLGLMGTLRTIVSCKVSTINGQSHSVVITGTSRHVPVISNPDSGSATIRFEDVSANMSSFSGSGDMVIPRPPYKDNDPPTLRPFFENMTLSWKLSGTAKVISGAAESRLRFQQTRKESSKLLPGYRIGRRRMSPFLPPIRPANP